jgi:ubiquinone/menaquinone biosynthesis C-methylase UbiE
MPLSRVLEPEVMDTREEAADYDSMDHSHVNKVFADDLLAFVRKNTNWLADDAEGGADVEILDLGTGTARIPVEICRRHSACRIVAVDLSVHMLDLARYNVEAAGFARRILLAHVDAKQSPFAAKRFPIVISNSIVHHIPAPSLVFAEANRAVAPGGVIFLRDLLRPDSKGEIDRLVAQYAGNENDHQQAMFAASLAAALTLDEVRACVAEHGYPADSVQATSDRHWTWATVAPAN